MTVNVELLQKTLDTIKANPQHWDQYEWHCNSNHCFAGFAELLANKLSVTTNSYELKSITGISQLPIYNGVNWNTKFNATELLGITLKDADTLFTGSNSLEDLKTMVNYLIENGSLDCYERPYHEDEDEF